MALWMALPWIRRPIRHGPEAGLGRHEAARLPGPGRTVAGRPGPSCSRRESVVPGRHARSVGASKRGDHRGPPRAGQTPARLLGYRHRPDDASTDSYGRRSGHARARIGVQASGHAQQQVELSPRPRFRRLVRPYESWHDWIAETRAACRHAGTLPRGGHERGPTPDPRPPSSLLRSGPSARQLHVAADAAVVRPEIPHAAFRAELLAFGGGRER